MTKHDSDIARLIGLKIKQKDPNAEVILYGSHARNNANSESDWDILILIDAPKKSRKIEDIYRDELFNLELEIGEPISTLIYSKDDWEKKYTFTPLYNNIKNEGIKLA